MSKVPRKPPRPRRTSRPLQSPPPRAIPAAERTGERIQKLLAAAGYGSRRQIDAWLAAGRIEVNGRTAQPGDRATIADELKLDGAALDLRPKTARPRVLLYYKPEGEIVSRSDPEGRRTVFERLPRLATGRWVSIGRLDLNSAGLLLLTDSGDLANRLMHPRHGVEREYAARISRELTWNELGRLRSGVPLEDGPARFERIEPGDKRVGANRWYRVTLLEGRNREVRRMFEVLGVQVSRLLRTRMGSIRLPRDLKPGRWLELPDAEVERLMQISRWENIVREPKSC